MTDETIGNSGDDRNCLDNSDLGTEPREPTMPRDTDDLQSDQRESPESESTGTGEVISPEKQISREVTTGLTHAESSISTSAEFYGRDQVRVKHLKAKIIEDE